MCKFNKSTRSQKAINIIESSQGRSKQAEKHGNKLHCPSSEN